MNTADPALLTQRCLAGDEQAIEIFVRAHEADVFRLALSIVRDPGLANEITQETFIAALRSLGTYQERSSIRAWLYTITLNTSRSHLRKNRALGKLHAALTILIQMNSAGPDSPEEAVIQNEQEGLLQKALERLDEKHRITIILRYFQGLSVAEIADVLSIHEGTVHSRLHTAREKLRQLLGSFHGE